MEGVHTPAEAELHTVLQEMAECRDRAGLRGKGTGGSLAQPIRVRGMLQEVLTSGGQPTTSTPHHAGDGHRGTGLLSKANCYSRWPQGRPNGHSKEGRRDREPGRHLSRPVSNRVSNPAPRSMCVTPSMLAGVPAPLGARAPTGRPVPRAPPLLAHAAAGLAGSRCHG